MKKLKWLLILPIPLLMYWAFKDLRLAALSELLGRLHLYQIGILLIVNLIFVLLLTGRWAIILRIFGYPQPLFSLAGYRQAGFALSYVTPGPQFGGEPLQIYLLTRKHDLPLAVGTASLVIDRALELLSNFAFLGLGALIVVNTVQPQYKALLFVPLLMFLLPAAYLVLAGAGVRPLSVLLAWILQPRRRSRDSVPGGRIRSRLENLNQLLNQTETLLVSFCRRPWTWALGPVFFVLIWGGSLLELGLILLFFDLPINPWQLVFILSGAKLAFLLPVPAAAGTLEASQVLVFGLLGLPPEAALGLVVYIRARDLLFVVSGFLFTLSRRTGSSRC